MPEDDEFDGDPTEAPRTSRFPHPVPAPPISAGRQGGVTSFNEEDEHELSKSRMLFVEVASFVLVISVVVQGTTVRWDGLTWYALSVGLVSLICCLFMRLADSVKPGSLSEIVSRNTDPRLRRQVTALDLITSLLLFWWTFGAFIITFRGPFTVTSNGYFSAWAGLGATVLWIKPNAKSVAEEESQKMEGRRKSLLCLFASSLVVLLASIPHARTGVGAYGISLGGFSLLASFVLLAVDRDEIVQLFRRIICTFLALIWLAGAVVLTFYKPFKDTGNGYFGSWLGLLSTMWYVIYDWET